MIRLRIPVALLLSVAATAGAALYLQRRAPDHDTLMGRRLLELAPTPGRARVDCRTFREPRPLVLLAIGQSNAGNHGQAGADEPPPTALQVMSAGVCSLTGDPLPGATGRGASLWSLLPARLAAAGIHRPVVLQVLAVDASLVDDWARESAPIARHLSLVLRANRASGLQPDLVLWQQGEADARAGTAPDRYAQGLLALAARLEAGGVHAPILLARSTVCRSAAAARLRAAVLALAASHPRFVVGPDTDSIEQRHDGCHLSASGRAQAATLWATSIAQLPPGVLRHLPE